MTPEQLAKRREAIEILKTLGGVSREEIDEMNQQPDVMCNLCGCGCRLEGDCNNLGGLIGAIVSGCYDSTPGNGSGALCDGEKYTFSLCEFCLDWLFGKFAIPVKVEDYFNGESVAYTPAHKVANQFTGRWREHFDKESTRRARIRHDQPTSRCQHQQASESMYEDPLVP